MSYKMQALGMSSEYEWGKQKLLTGKSKKGKNLPLNIYLKDQR